MLRGQVCCWKTNFGKRIYQFETDPSEKIAQTIAQKHQKFTKDAQY